MEEYVFQREQLQFVSMLTKRKTCQLSLTWVFNKAVCVFFNPLVRLPGALVPVWEEDSGEGEGAAWELLVLEGGHGSLHLHHPVSTLQVSPTDTHTHAHTHARTRTPYHHRADFTPPFYLLDPSPLPKETPEALPLMSAHPVALLASPGRRGPSSSVFRA